MVFAKKNLIIMLRKCEDVIHILAHKKNAPTKKFRKCVLLMFTFYYAKNFAISIFISGVIVIVRNLFSAALLRIK